MDGGCAAGGHAFSLVLHFAPWRWTHTFCMLKLTYHTACYTTVSLPAPYVGATTNHCVVVTCCMACLYLPSALLLRYSSTPSPTTPAPLRYPSLLRCVWNHLFAAVASLGCISTVDGRVESHLHYELPYQYSPILQQLPNLDRSGERHIPAGLLWSRTHAHADVPAAAPLTPPPSWGGITHAHTIPHSQLVIAVPTVIYHP